MPRIDLLEAVVLDVDGWDVFLVFGRGGERVSIGRLGDVMMACDLVKTQRLVLAPSGLNNAEVERDVWFCENGNASCSPLSG